MRGSATLTGRVCGLFRGAIDDRNTGAVLQAGLAIRDGRLPLLQSFRDDGGHAVVALNLHDLAGNGLVGFDDVDEQLILTVPDRRRWHREDTGAGSDQQPCVDELTRPELVAGV